MDAHKKTLWMKLMEWLWDRGGPCHSCTVSLSKSMDRRLGPIEWWRMRFHMYFCHWCRDFKKQTALLRQQARELAQALNADISGSPLSLSPDSRERMKARLRAEFGGDQ